jgi:hypothetical protein
VEEKLIQRCRKIHGSKVKKEKGKRANVKKEKVKRANKLAKAKEMRVTGLFDQRLLTSSILLLCRSCFGGLSN